MVTVTTLGAITGQVVSKGFGALFGEVLKQVSRNINKEDENILSGKKVHNYFQSTFERCTKVKTLINRDVAVDLLQSYVNIHFSTRSATGVQEKFDDYSLIEKLKKDNRCIIIGTAGGGKTVFMRYLWISFFTNPEGKIPIYLELRRLNDLTSVDIVSFISHNCLDTKTESGSAHFKRLLSEGRLLFILDGFDEVAIEKRVGVERQIIELGRRYPKVTIVVSGRPDDKFDAWQDFNKVCVCPLSKEQVLKLLERVGFDELVKSKFISAVKKDLYEKHESFLSSPLLATMMLLTFRYYAEIPNKIHVFYDLAFDTLFSMHDALKEAFSRKKYSDLPIDLFKRRLACFCLISYIDQKFEFTNTEALDYISRSAKIDNVKINASHFLQDLLESVCIMQRDGLNLSFTHRSFQEYFTSCCLSNFKTDKLSLIIPKLARRRSDNVLIMLFDMSKDLVEEAYVLPNLDIQLKNLKDRGPAPNCNAIMEMLEYSIHIRSGHKHALATGTRAIESDAQNFRRALQFLYPRMFRISSRKIDELYNIDIGMYESFPFHNVFKDPAVINVVLESKRSKFISYVENYSKPKIKLSEAETDKIASWFLRSGHYQFFCLYYKKLFNATLAIPRAHRKRQRDTDGLLGIIDP